MRAHAQLRIGTDGAIERLVDDPPIGWRPTPEAVYLVGTAGGPTGDDHVRLDLEVGAGAHLAVRSSAASVVYAGSGTTQHVCASIGAGADIDWNPEPVIVTSGARHRQLTSIESAPGARVDWTELVILGRHGEEPGRADLTLDCTAAGRPLLRHRLTIGAPGWDGPAVLGGNRAIGLHLVVGPSLRPPSVHHGRGWSWMRLSGPGWLLTAVADDLPELLTRIEAAGGRASAGASSHSFR